MLHQDNATQLCAVPNTGVFMAGVQCLFARTKVAMMAVALSTALCACSPEHEQTLAKTSPVVATVNGEPITAADVDFTLERTFSQLDLLQADASLRAKVLESLIASRAMKQKMIKELAEEELARITHSVKAYEEELFVKEYLQKYIAPAPVTAAMVQQYYDSHLEEFGAETVRDFELLKAPPGLDDQQRDHLLQAIATIRSAPDWQATAKSWQQEYGLHYQQGRSKAGLLHKTIEQTLATLKKGETSAVFYLDGQLHLVRVTDAVQTAPRALAEVSGDIRKKLAPLLLREAVKNASLEVRSNAEVVVMDAEK